jgi:hypothetical protein
MPVGVCERSKSVVLHLEDPVGVIEGLGLANERHRAEWLGGDSGNRASEQYQGQAQPFGSHC